jgi:hypothetical protein
MADARALSEQVFYICAAWATIYISVELRLRVSWMLIHRST